MIPQEPHTSRMSHLELPQGNEVMHISDAEEKRPLLSQKKAVHYVDFSSIRKIYEHYQCDSYIFKTSELGAPEILERGRQETERLVSVIASKIPSKTEIKLLKNAYSYLSEEDKPQPSDFIYVFGAKTPLRPAKAADLYRQKLAPKIILSGRGPFYGKVGDVAETERYAAITLEAGVPNSALIVEDASITIPDNVRRTLNMLDAQHIPYRSVIIVNSPYTQRRGWCVWKKHTPDSVAIYRVNAETSRKFDADHWYKNQDGLKLVLGEFVKLRNTVAFNDA